MLNTRKLDSIKMYHSTDRQRAFHWIKPFALLRKIILLYDSITGHYPSQKKIMEKLQTTVWRWMMHLVTPPIATAPYTIPAQPRSQTPTLRFWLVANLEASSAPSTTSRGPLVFLEVWRAISQLLKLIPLSPKLCYGQKGYSDDVKLWLIEVSIKSS